LEGKKAHPSNYRGCRHAKELLRKKTQRTPKITTGRVFPTKFMDPGIPFVVASVAGKRMSSNIRHARWRQLLAQWN
jgi:hypothetical protein